MLKRLSKQRKQYVSLARESVKHMKSFERKREVPGQNGRVGISVTAVATY